MTSPNHNTNILIDLLTTTLKHASHVVEDKSERLSKLLHELECAFEKVMYTSQACSWMNVTETELVFREEVLQCNAVSEVSKKLVDILNAY